MAFLQTWTRFDASGAPRLQPEVFNKAQEWLGEGGKALADWDISRDAPYFGIPIPDAPGKYFYVWLDAPVGYLASLKAYFDSGNAKANTGTTQTFAEFLSDPATEQVHFIGKDIVYFHTLFWPAMLKFAGTPYKVPDRVYVHGFITFQNEKMSKSRGTGISPDTYLDLGLNPEWLRYYLATKMNAKVEDIDFNPDDFLARVNSDLVGKYVNIASRAAGFLNAGFEGRLLQMLPQVGGVAHSDDDELEDVVTTLLASADELAALYQNRECRQGRAPDHGTGRRSQSIHRYGKALGAREASGSIRSVADRVQRCDQLLSAAYHLSQAGASFPRGGGGSFPQCR